MTDKTTLPSASLPPASDFLIRGSDYLASKGEFRLIGRDEEIKTVTTVLMKRDNNNLVLYGPGGVGLSSIILGVQASKDDLNTPFDVVGKKFYWLDIDGLFSSGDAAKINEGFQKALATLSRTPDTVLVIEDTKDFLDGIRNSGTSHIVNALMKELRGKRFQVIFEARDENIAELFKAHSDIAESFTFQSVLEPPKESLRAMVKDGVKSLEEHHGIKISDAAVDSVVELTTKYPGLTLNTAQPKRSVVILEGALTAFRYNAHTTPPGLAGLNSLSADEIAGIKQAWETQQRQIRSVYADQRVGEESIRRIDDEIAEQRRLAAEAAKKTEAAEAPVDKKPDAKGFGAMLGKSGFDSEPVRKLKDKRAEWEKAVNDNRRKYGEIAGEMNKDLVLGSDHVLGEFSRLSRIPMSKLQQDEATKLLKLEETLKARVFGQDEPIEALSKSVRRGRKGLKKPNKPIGSFLFLGPSGVGKTELAKALAASLFGDEAALKTYDMSEYQEKHAGATLIGAPPGYEGYEAGGVLTNAMRAQPYCVNVFDEIEKAHKDVFDLFLQIIDEGRLTDRRGVPASFGNSINIMTSNIGAKYFLDEGLSFEEAKDKALKDLWDPSVGGFRPEFLNRFTGIFCFNRLGLPQIEMIAGKSIKELNSWIADKGLKVEMSEEDRAAMCKDHYVPRAGGRGILNYIEQNVTSDVAETMLKSGDEAGTLKVTYNKAAKKVSAQFVPEIKAEKPTIEKPAMLRPAV